MSFLQKNILKGLVQARGSAAKINLKNLSDALKDLTPPSCPIFLAGIKTADVAAKIGLCGCRTVRITMV